MPQFIDYDTVQDKVYYLGYGTYVCFTVKLAKKDKDGNRIHFHKEYEYNSSYIDTEKAVSIKRDFDFYLTIENKSENIYIQIRMENIIGLNSILQNMVNLLMNDKLWAIKERKLIMKGAVSPMTIDLPMDKWLSFEPTVIQYDNNQFNKGVQILLSDNGKFINIDIDKFMGLVYLLNTFDMYGNALSIVNYLNWSSYGTNLVSFNTDDGSFKESEERGVSAPTGRTVQKIQTKSYFDLDKL